MNKKAIGVFDSGLGGLTCVKEIMKVLPNEDVIYFGDTGRVPYGTRSEKTIIKYVEGDINFLSAFDVKVIVIACGTASSVALEYAREKYDIPLIGVVEPAVKTASKATKNGNIGVIGTPGTIRSGMYERLLKELDASFNVTSAACPMFVPLVENGYIKHEATRLIAAEYLAPLKEKGIDTLIMGCTHYPLLRDTIDEFFEGRVKLIDAGEAAGEYLKEFLAENNMRNDSCKEGSYKFCVSDSVEGFSKLGSMFLNKELSGEVEKIDIEKY